ncbi:SMC domain protein [Methanobacterium lacus]|uniref:SMC domain protein n=1 Tax=Methanobacterium lacus (strain AL-21) TaxID=877455 RepID=F0T8W3_METLA|nr:AAA family ATPase [Methanobacterium lacus]ADZ09791.1 SMC domain protein [Methanobacterium lacus]
MKVLELEITNFRGIKNLKINPAGKNFMIIGPNGSGKSAVVDAVDFLLTGQISRMTGKGTKGINLKKHGPHIDHSPQDAKVRAVVQIHGVEEPIEIQRTLDSPNNLICTDSVRDNLQPVLELASRGQHVLTRREILNYVNADSSTRGKQIQTLLKITDVEKTRSILNQIKNTLKTNHTAKESALKTITSTLCNNIGIDTFDSSKILAFTNLNRKILGGKPLEILSSEQLKLDIKSQNPVSNSGLNLDLLKKDIENLSELISDENQKEISKIILELHELIEDINSNPNLKKSNEQLKLTRLGIQLINPEGKCPLCDKPWKKGDLKTHLNNKIDELKGASEKLDKIEKLTECLINDINLKTASLNEIIKATDKLELNNEKDILNHWLDSLKELLSSIEDETYFTSKIDSEKVSVTFSPEHIDKVLEGIYSIAVKKTPEPSKELTAWDNLTRLEENLNNYEISRDDFNKSFKSYYKAEILLNTFLESRNSVLDKLFTEIKDRFVELYKELHGIDEKNFDAQIVSDGAGVTFKVDFHGKGVNPPNAMHSEGHQDSMGICLYLALAERLTTGYIDIIILDDVMMSVDAPHRRQICHMLAEFFKGKQFFITTHDQTWARQLQSEGVIKAKNRIEFSNWTIQNGPSINVFGDIWELINTDLNKNDIPSAAAKLRRGSEEYFTQVCASLRAPVKFNFNGQYELGDLLTGALSEYKTQLKHAKSAANSWGNNEELEKLKEVELFSKDVFKRLNMERWAINPAVHYNQWADFTHEDFKPVVETFHDLFSIFKCSECGTLLHLITQGPRAEVVKCNCGNVNWNLIDK